MQISTNEDLIIVNLDVPDKEAVIRELGTMLLNQGFVCEEFIDAVLQREQLYPTGLPTEIPIAIPHADTIFCKQDGLAIATLRDNVKFHEMGDAEKELDVSMVFMLSIKEPEQQVKFLQKLVTVFKDKDCLEELRSSKDRHTLAEAVKRILEKE